MALSRARCAREHATASHSGQSVGETRVPPVLLGTPILPVWRLLMIQASHSEVPYLVNGLLHLCSRTLILLIRVAIPMLSSWPE